MSQATLTTVPPEPIEPTYTLTIKGSLEDMQKLGGLVGQVHVERSEWSLAQRIYNALGPLPGSYRPFKVQTEQSPMNTPSLIIVPNN